MAGWEADRVNMGPPEGPKAVPTELALTGAQSRNIFCEIWEIRETCLVCNRVGRADGRVGGRSSQYGTSGGPQSCADRVGADRCPGPKYFLRDLGNPERHALFAIVLDVRMAGREAD